LDGILFPGGGNSAQFDYVGWSVAVDGGTAVVGAPGTNFDQGAVYIFEKTASGWPQVPTLTLANPSIANPSTANYYFGSSVAIDGSTIVVGASSHPFGPAGAAYVYTRAGANGWPATPTVTLNDPAATNHDHFGASVAVDGSTIVVGAPYSPYDNTNFSTGPGEAYVYSAVGNGWPSTPTATLQDPTATPDDQFGASVAVENSVVAVDGGMVNHDAAAYLYVQGTGNLWPSSPTTTIAPVSQNDCTFGCSVALDEDRTLVVGAMYSNAAYIYPWTAGGWSGPTTLGEPGGGGPRFGISVAVDNGKLVVGDDQSVQASCATGVAYEFIKGPSGWPTTASATYTDPFASLYGLCGDRFGASVAVQGQVAVIGALNTFFSYGAASIFTA
jgi:hypothetical protein